MNFKKIILNTIVLLGLVFFSLTNNLYAQDQVYQYSEGNQNFLRRGVVLDDDNILFGGANFYEYSNNIADRLVKVFNTETNTLTDYEFQNIIPTSIDRGILVDVKRAKNGEVIMAFNNFFDKNQQYPFGTFSYVRYNPETGKEKVVAIRSKIASNIMIQHVLIESEDDADHFLIVGAERYDINFGIGYYFAEFKGDSLIFEDVVEEVPTLTYNNDDFYKVGDNYTLVTNGGISSPSSFFSARRNEVDEFVIDSNASHLPNDDAYATENERVRGYSSSGIKNVFLLNDSTLVSPSRLATTDLFIHNPTKLFDTTSLGLYFFTPEIDSIKFVDISRKYGYKYCYDPFLSQTKKGDYCFGGSMNDFINRNEEANAPYSTGLIAMLNDTGKILWEHEIKEEFADLRITAVVATNDGGCVFAGDRVKEGVTNGIDMIVVKMDSLGTLTSISDESLTHLFDKQKIAAYPNPAQSQGKVNLSWSGMQKQNWQVKFYDKQGRLVYATEVLQGASESNIQLPELPSGNYIIRAEGSGKQVHTGTLVID
jgi:hypothetical protein